MNDGLTSIGGASKAWKVPGVWVWNQFDFVRWKGVIHVRKGSRLAVLSAINMCEEPEKRTVIWRSRLLSAGTVGAVAKLRWLCGARAGGTVIW